MDDFKKLTEQLMKIYSNAESVNDLGIENYFDENISLIGTGKHRESFVMTETKYIYFRSNRSPWRFWLS